MLFLISAARVMAADVETHWVEFESLAPAPVALKAEFVAPPQTVPVIIFAAPQTVYQVRPEAAAIAKSFSQPVNYEYRLEAQPAIVMKYSGETRLEDVWAGNLTQGNLGFANSVSVAADISRSLTASVRLEAASHFNDVSQMDFANRLEVAAANKKTKGLAANVTAGLASITDPTGAIIDQRYARMELVQDLPMVPVHLRVAPSLSSEHRVTSDRLLTGLESAVLVDVTHQTVFTFGVAEVSAVDDSIVSNTSNYRTFYVQTEQKLSPETTMSVRAAYEEHTNNDVQSDGAMFLGVNSSFPVVDSIRGGFQLRQRLAEIVSSAQSLPETLLSFSLGGGF